MWMLDTLSTFARDGFAIVPDALSAAEVAALVAAADTIHSSAEDEIRGG